MGERARDSEALATKGRRRKSGGWTEKATTLPGEISPQCLKRRRAVAKVVQRRSAVLLANLNRSNRQAPDRHFR